MFELFIIALVVGVAYYFIRIVSDWSQLSKPGIEGITKETELLPYEKKPYLMTNAERAFFKVLYEQTKDKFYIVPQVPLSNIVQVEYAYRWYYEHRNRINRVYVDFVLFDREYFTPQLVIELDDKSHDLPKRMDRDHFVDKVLRKAGIRIKHVKTSYQYDPAQIAVLLQK